VVVGLLLAFRTNNAYDRYYEGRKLFSSMCTQIRNSARAIWIGLEESSKEEHAEKIQTIKLLLAFAVAVKHHLRLEFGTHWEDLEDILPPGFQFTRFEGNADQSETGGDNPDDPNNRPTVPKRRPAYVRAPLRNVAGRLPPTYGYHNSGSEVNLIVDNNWDDEVQPSMSLPLEIVYNLGLIVDAKFRETKLDGARFGFVSGTMNVLIEILGNLERIGNTPIPHAYNIHLKQAVTLYVWTLPLTLVPELKWLTVPAIFVISFILFGVEAIGAEIENPFGYDKNDLPLDEYCKDLEGEIKYLEYHIPEKKDIEAEQHIHQAQS
jgi:putative membrane protein